MSNALPFDLEDAEFPKALKDAALTSGGYPYDRKLKRSRYEKHLTDLQIELVKFQQWVQHKGERVVIVFEGRDSAGKGGTIGAFRQYLNPRWVRTVALSKPTERERGQWYFQRYVDHLPTQGEIVLFDRSWYNRAGVEPVMGFCSDSETEKFLTDVPRFESMLVDEGIHLFKIWLNIGREMQWKRFHDRRHSPLKVWKLSPIDVSALGKWDAYTSARDQMLDRTHTDIAPWTIVRSNDKRRARLNAIQHVLTSIDYPGRDQDTIGATDPLVLGNGPGFLIGSE
ncbi:polyphosphate kinase 2 [Coralliovum pocilloporae]|uniref:polyphosphate kinase 2 n=1 Tax=Coralliovum pocilloporae TaxID=3066369 RepID=UPI003306A442